MFLVVPTFLVATAVAQPGLPAPVTQVAEVRNERILQRIELPGTVLSRRVSRVAAEVAGLVENFPVRLGDTVRKGQMLTRLRTESLELRLKAAQAQLQEDEARKKLAEHTLQRVRGLFESEVLSRQQLDEAQYEFEAWEGRIERLRAEIDQLKDEIERSSIKAPFDAVVILETTQLGEWLAVGDTVVELASLDELEIAVDLPERYFRGLRPGTRAAVTFDSLPGVEIQGTVSHVIPQADLQARTFPVRLEIPNRQGQIGIGMLARVVFPFGGTRSGLIVPKDAVVNQGDERIVYLLDSDDTVRRVVVQTGAAMGDWIEVRGPLSAGLKVVTRGNERLRDGQKVRAEVVEYSPP